MTAKRAQFGVMLLYMSDIMVIYKYLKKYINSLESCLSRTLHANLATTTSSLATSKQP